MLFIFNFRLTQEVEYNEAAPQKDAVIEYLRNIGYILFCEKFSKT